MHAYVARVQSVLQAGKPDNDVLFYWPEADQQDDAQGLMRQQGMHENEWLVHSPAGRGALQMIESGYSLDFISDAQLQALTVKDGWLLAPGGRYRLLVVPAVERMPVETLSALAQVAQVRRGIAHRCVARRRAGTGAARRAARAAARVAGVDGAAARRRRGLGDGRAFGRGTPANRRRNWASGSRAAHVTTASTTSS